MKKQIVWIGVLMLGLILVVALMIFRTAPDQPLGESDLIEYKDILRVNQPKANQTITSPLSITGEARGSWFFEATFPVILVNWDGLIIAQHYAQARGEWMTEEFVPFETTLEFENPAFPGSDETHFSRRGSLILQKSNPSGLPEYDDALEIPVWFEGP
ncbi:MAG: hypothetical protein A3J30_02540 [Candidatus Wildermuthbacteria bacterium RIFCSPLOWO2_02_FULL_47_9c]|uniref:Bacterial spore germination immunoglobulin-like domain-containing protein n=2 Tax=Parcubacteria group TaxID=1794811 RepID=A0A837IQX7_9BACT|nr:MAG: hypothetical protein UY25_C0002G0137 [Candidatus Yanofskybacteria bacterium GW2011_GWC1_48_11]KKW04614.1 MAG: hypothetical protein UY38_C0001G0181 [Parcubacteria group bacterium GW2011_GWB1_49_12]KKW09128.1 MAG: hypothetical protein UY45_C0001G0014 [Parcubacteria group bacterium GW2011_GWA1_49_26]KKW13601.1 MAG: hypothetical protein UY53_C0010G0010 [Parcubacteria group bacterium GW2011_GWA2_50_10]OHA61385.1 MAG: hypothetical protein A2109_00675 [Candidatus Wildermuthbacteria bacterium G